jgi:TRAP-type transport system periplasmic protein
VERLKKLGATDKSSFAKAAAPIQDQLAKELGPHAVPLLDSVRKVR